MGRYVIWRVWRWAVPTFDTSPAHSPNPEAAPTIRDIAGDVDIETRPLDGPLVRLVCAAVDTHGLPGLAAGVCTEEETLGLGVHGVRRAGGHEDLVIEDRFHLGSNVKACTAMLAATTVEDGLLDWESLVLEVFPEHRATAHADHQALTLDDLLAHRGGLPPWETLEDLPDNLTGDPRQQREQTVAVALATEPVVPPGQFRYSNAGYGVAGAMVERVLDQPWEDALTERVLDPLGLRGVCSWPLEASPAAPWGHHHQDGRFVPHDGTGPDYAVPAAVAPAGHLSMSVPDNLALLQAHLAGLHGRSPLLTAHTYRRQHGLVHSHVDGSYGHGWAIHHIGGHQTSIHVGGAGTFLAIMAIQPEPDIGAVVIANAGGDPVEDALLELTIETLELPRR